MQWVICGCYCAILLTFLLKIVIINSWKESHQVLGFDNSRVKLNSSSQEPSTCLKIWWRHECSLSSEAQQRAKQQSIPQNTHLKQFMLLKSLPGNIQGEIIWIYLQMAKEVQWVIKTLEREQNNRTPTSRLPSSPNLQILTTPLTKLRYLGIISWKSSVMNTRRT